MYTDTCFTAQALARLLLDLQDKFINVVPNEFLDHTLPRFADVYVVFVLLTDDIQGIIVIILKIYKQKKIF